MRLFSTEQVSKYHPDKYADQISDAILDACLENDENSRVACETLVKDDVIILAGEITSGAGVDYREIARNVAQKLGYPSTGSRRSSERSRPKSPQASDAAKIRAPGIRA